MNQGLITTECSLYGRLSLPRGAARRQHSIRKNKKPIVGFPEWRHPDDATQRTPYKPPIPLQMAPSSLPPPVPPVCYIRTQCPVHRGQERHSHGKDGGHFQDVIFFQGKSKDCSSHGMFCVCVCVLYLKLIYQCHPIILN